VPSDHPRKCANWNSPWAASQMSKFHQVLATRSPDALTAKTFISSDVVIVCQLLCFCRHESLMISTFPKWPCNTWEQFHFNVLMSSYHTHSVELGMLNDLFYNIVINYTKWDFSHMQNFQKAQNPRRGPHT